MQRLLTDLIAAGLLGIGAAAAIAPRAMATMFGVPADDAHARAYLLAACARDAIVGATILAVRDDAVLRRRALGLASLIGLADAAIIASARGIRPAHVAHVGGFIVTALVALTDVP